MTFTRAGSEESFRGRSSQISGRRFARTASHDPCELWCPPLEYNAAREWSATALVPFGRRSVTNLGGTRFGST